MGESKKIKKKCCHKFEKKGIHCSSCPLTQEKDQKSNKEKDKKKDKK